MGLAINVYAIRADALESVPPGIRRFIDNFFTDKEIFGIPCAIAVGCDDKAPWYFMDDDEEDYTEGLSEEEINDNGVFSWFENHPEVVFEYYWS